MTLLSTDITGLLQIESISIFGVMIVAIGYLVYENKRKDKIIKDRDSKMFEIIEKYSQLATRISERLGRNSDV